MAEFLASIDWTDAPSIALLVLILIKLVNNCEDERHRR
jgi:hypothetical protein